MKVVMSGKPVKFPNLEAEMTRVGLSKVDIADGIGRTPDTVWRWFSGRNGFAIDDAFAVRDHFFPNLSVDYLFNQHPISNDVQ